MCLYLPAKFEVSRIILTSFRQEGTFTTPKKITPKMPMRTGVK